MVIEQDSTGRLWATAEGGGKIVVYYTTSSDHRNWSSARTLRSGVDADDISAIIAFDDDKIGVAWSDQKRHQLGFSIRDDDDSPTSWSGAEIFESGSGSMDDHLNLACDSSGRVYVVSKGRLGLRESLPKKHERQLDHPYGHRGQRQHTSDCDGRRRRQRRVRALRELEPSSAPCGVRQGEPGLPELRVDGELHLIVGWQHEQRHGHEATSPRRKSRRDREPEQHRGLLERVGLPARDQSAAAAGATHRLRCGSRPWRARRAELG